MVIGEGPVMGAARQHNPQHFPMCAQARRRFAQVIHMVVHSKACNTFSCRAGRQRVSVPVELAMRYQNPSIESAVKNLAAKGATEVLLIPLFPHYAMSSYETAVVRVQEVAAQLAPQPFQMAQDKLNQPIAKTADAVEKQQVVR